MTARHINSICHSFRKLTRRLLLTLTMLATAASMMLISTSCCLAADDAIIEVRVGAYTFPPYFDGKAGVTTNLLELLNKSQRRYHFSLVVTSSRRRYQDLLSSGYDMILFEDPVWEWKDLKVQIGRTLINDSEVYFAQKKKVLDQGIFNNIAQQRIVCVMGYHYAFANFNADPDYLRQSFNISLVQHASLVIPKLLDGYADVAILPLSYLYRQQTLHPELKQSLLISERHDQDYKLASIFRDNSPISVSEFDTLIARLESDGSWQAFLKQENMRPDPSSPREGK